MSSRYEQILEANSADTPPRWRSFARRTAPVYSDETNTWGALAYGYKAAADIVAKDYVNSNRYRDVLFSPIFFLYRHYIELELKYTWKQYYAHGWLDCEPPGNEHRLSKLWRTIRQTSAVVGFFAPDDEFILWVEKSIQLFNSTDRRSMHSRYPTVGSKCHSLHIDVKELILAVDDIDTVFFGLRAMIQERDEWF